MNRRRRDIDYRPMLKWNAYHYDIILLKKGLLTQKDFQAEA